ncbi:unnamed protein product [Cladocopium goreaui]|uniref:Uncharacterized protein n=1 Tax=Cladocopium goreaui TaxID=2562237 RepID=A0A9P1C5Q8_9DINO|nr:unnamed protein product [Cladocopium goreaui]
MPLEKKGNGWRARRKKGDTTFSGPIRTTEAAANEDKQQLEEAAPVSMDRLEVHARLRRRARRALPAPSVAQHGSGWRIRVTIDKKRVCGPTRKTRAEAEKDSRRLTESEHRNTAELQSAVERLHQEVAEVGADMDQEVADMDEERHGAGRHVAD